ncbi:MAG: hypothetical protein Q8M94_01880 [Ignavibacteria bacterium]|nr:hypothetical protein [Ignavibacteria bacterium]
MFVALVQGGGLGAKPLGWYEEEIEGRKEEEDDDDKLFSKWIVTVKINKKKK